MTMFDAPVQQAQAPLSVVVLTANEEKNLEACLSSVWGWTQQLFVVDSGSTDATPDIAARFGARVVVHPFESHARQWRWALDTLPIQSRWILALDADQRVTPELRAAIFAALARPDGPGAPDAFFVNRRQVFRGRWIRHGGYYPKPLLKLFRRGVATLDEAELVDHHFHVAGAVGRLKGDLVEDNRNEAQIADWIAKHTRYARLQAAEELARLGSGTRSGRLSGNPDQRVAWLKEIWMRLPLYVRPALYFTYRYFVRLGFLDGKQGFVFHALQAFWYRLLVDINRDEMRRHPDRQMSTSARGAAVQPASTTARPFDS